MTDVSRLNLGELLALHSEIAEELRRRGVVRSSNNPTGDLAEYLFCRAFGWQQADNSVRSYDATAADGTRYQIKGRRMTQHNRPRQLSALRELPSRGFDFLAGVLLAADYTVIRAALIPHRLVLDNSTYIEHTNSWKFHLRDVVWDWPGVEDVTERLRAVAAGWRSSAKSRSTPKPCTKTRAEAPSP
jgi:hypothetical protein